MAGDAPRNPARADWVDSRDQPTNRPAPIRAPAPAEVCIMRRTVWIAFLGMCLSLLAAPLAAPAQEYAIKVAKPGPGDQLQVKNDNNTEIEFKVLDAGGTALMEKK